jgi:3,4-dihydroxy 2-butanone 4-phosphate synthase / GTP cyclohydrolase II
MTRPIVMAVASAGEARRFAARNELEFADVLHLAGAELPTRHGTFRLEAFATLAQPDRHHLALVRGDVRTGAPIVHVHAACPASERFGSLLCDCAARLERALDEIAAAEAGVLVYLCAEADGLVRGLGVCPSPDGDAAPAILRALGVGCYQAEPART